jgi:hypothetical protein
MLRYASHLPITGNIEHPWLLSPAPAATAGSKHEFTTPRVSEVLRPRATERPPASAGSLDDARAAFARGELLAWPSAARPTW